MVHKWEDEDWRLIGDILVVTEYIYIVDYVILTINYRYAW